MDANAVVRGCVLLLGGIVFFGMPYCAEAAATSAVVTDEQTAPGASVAPSDASDQRSAGQLQEIVVTAQKRAETANTVPMSIVAMTGAQLQEQGIESVSDLSRIVPSLTTTSSYFGAASYTIRGVGFYDSALGSRPAVGVYVDQVELPFAAMASGANLDLERVEVLEGPQGTLFGQNVTGGIINYIAAKPTNTLKYGGGATYGRFDEGEVNGFVSGPLNDVLSARVAVKHSFGDGWQYSYTRDDRLGHINTSTGRVLLDFHPNDVAKFELNMNVWTDHSDTQASQVIATILRGTAPVPAGLLNYPAPPPERPCVGLDAWQLATVRHLLSGITARRYRSRQDRDFDFDIRLRAHESR